ncbi:hypothetical protein DAI22_01g064700 [Oryza sativa Japonica Group]|nr:hypothetical protein DAI22_01g064700 [Oryza sativa Japonica Group]
MDGLIVVHGRVRIKKKPWKGLNSSKMNSDCTKLTSMIREMFVKKNVHPPYLKHLLGKLEALAVDVFTVRQQLAFDYHISLIPSLNRVNLVYQIKRCYDGWDDREKMYFRFVADNCTVPEDWCNTLMSKHLFRLVILEGQKRNIIYGSNGMSAFHLVRNYNTHAPEHSWIHVFVDSKIEHYQWFQCDSGIELMVPKYLGDFLAEAVFKFIEDEFDLTHVLRTCFALGSYVTDSLSDSSSDESSSESSSYSPSPRKRKRRNSVSHRKRKSRRCSSSSSSSMSDYPPRKRKKSHSTKKESSKKCKIEH